MSVNRSTPRTRNDPRKALTRAAIIEMAETLFARHGIEGVSLRQIGSAIGSANTSVVAYHFGSKEGLVEAIFHHRLPAIEARRRALLDAALEAGEEGDALPLLRALWQPLFEQLNGDGKHSYAGFMGALMHSGMGRIRLDLSPEYPTAGELGERLKACMPTAVRGEFDNRVLIVTVMITGALKLIDEAGRGPDGRALFEDTLRMSCAALLAPSEKGEI